MMAKSPSIFCPSAQPDWDDAVVFGVISGSAEAPRLVHLEKAIPATKEVLALAEPVTAAEVFRFAAPCLEHGCEHFAAEKCRLAERIGRILPEIAEHLPRCAIRSQCRWWRQEGPAACRRCPQIVTDNYNPSELMKRAALG